MNWEAIEKRLAALEAQQCLVFSGQNVGIGGSLRVGALPSGTWNASPSVAGFLASADTSFAVTIARSGVSNPIEIAFGLDQSNLKGTIQVIQDGTAYKPLFLNPEGGGAAFGISSIPVYANNAAAVTGGLTAGRLYRSGGDPDHLMIVH
jgi:hypothetical protein